MKPIKYTLIASITSLALCSVSFAEEKNKERPDNFENELVAEVATEYIMMKDDKIMMVNKGDVTEVTETMTFENGVTVMADGKYKLSEDGEVMMLNNGDSLNMDGELTMGSYIKKVGGSLLMMEGTEEQMEVEETITLGDGSTLDTSGKITRPNGDEMVLDDGDKISMGGVVDKSLMDNGPEKKPYEKN